MGYLIKICTYLFDVLDGIGIRTYKEYETIHYSRTLCGRHKFTHQVKREAIRGSSEACYEMYCRRSLGCMSVQDLGDAELWLEKAISKRDYPDALVTSADKLLGDSDRVKINEALKKLKYALHHFGNWWAWMLLLGCYKREKFRKADFSEMISYEELRNYCLNLILLKSHYEDTGQPGLTPRGIDNNLVGIDSKLWDEKVEEYTEFFQFTENELHQHMTEAKFFKIFDKLEFERWFQKMKKDISEIYQYSTLKNEQKKNQSKNDDFKRAHISSLTHGWRVKCKFRLSPFTQSFKFLHFVGDIVWVEPTSYRFFPKTRKIPINQIEWILFEGLNERT